MGIEVDVDYYSDDDDEQRVPRRLDPEQCVLHQCGPRHVRLIDCFVCWGPSRSARSSAVRFECDCDARPKSERSLSPRKKRALRSADTTRGLPVALLTGN